MLICAGWLPPDIYSSRSCLALGASVGTYCPAHNEYEDSPNTATAPRFLYAVWFMVLQAPPCLWFVQRFPRPQAQAYPQALRCVREGRLRCAPVDKPSFVAPADTSRAMAQMKPAISRAIAVMTLFCSLPLARRLR
jgi:hypothetical protein